MSRQALVLRRRHTQHRGSFEFPLVSAPHTEHFTTFFILSVDTESLACSSSSAGTTGSLLGCDLRLIKTPTPDFTIADYAAA